MVNVTANPSYSVVVKSGADFHEMEKEYEEIGLWTETEDEYIIF